MTPCQQDVSALHYILQAVIKQQRYAQIFMKKTKSLVEDWMKVMEKA